MSTTLNTWEMITNTGQAATHHVYTKHMGNDINKHRPASHAPSPITAQYATKHA